MYMSGHDSSIKSELLHYTMWVIEEGNSKKERQTDFIELEKHPKNYPLTRRIRVTNRQFLRRERTISYR